MAGGRSTSRRFVNSHKVRPSSSSSGNISRFFLAVAAADDHPTTTTTTREKKRDDGGNRRVRGHPSTDHRLATAKSTDNDDDDDDDDGWEEPVGLTAEAAIEIDDGDEDGEDEVVGDDGIEPERSSGNGRARADVGTGSGPPPAGVEDCDGAPPMPSSTEARMPRQGGAGENDGEHQGDKSDVEKATTTSDHRRLEGGQTVRRAAGNAQDENNVSSEKRGRGAGRNARPLRDCSDEEGDENSGDVNDDDNDADGGAADAINPFASFAFGAPSSGPTAGARGAVGAVADAAEDRAPGDGGHVGSIRGTECERLPRRLDGSDEDNKRGRQLGGGSSGFTDNRHRKRYKPGGAAASSSCADYTPLADLPVEQQSSIRRKWQSLSDPDADLEVRRFQVLVAARLHARCQEPVVRDAMRNLREYFSDSSPSPPPHTDAPKKSVCGDRSKGGCQQLCAETLSKANPDQLSRVIPSVLFANVKARHIVQAANEVAKRFGGTVPESLHGLKQLTGIGPKLADVLSVVNTRAAYRAEENEG